MKEFEIVKGDIVLECECPNCKEEIRYYGEFYTGQKLDKICYVCSREFIVEAD